MRFCYAPCGTIFTVDESKDIFIKISECCGYNCFNFISEEFDIAIRAADIHIHSCIANFPDSEKITNLRYYNTDGKSSCHETGDIIKGKTDGRFYMWFNNQWNLIYDPAANYCKRDVKVTEDLNDFCDDYCPGGAYGVPKIKDVIFHDPATIVFWKDGTKTVVKKQKGDKYDKEKGLALCIAKKTMGNNYKYYNIFEKWLKKGK